MDEAAAGHLRGFCRAASPPHVRRLGTVYTGLEDMSIWEKRCGQGIRIQCASRSGTGFLLSCVLRIPDCVRAGETAPIQLLSSPEASLFQMGFRSEAFLGRLDGLTGRSAGRRDLVRLGKKILGASRETGGWAKAAGVGAAGGALAQSGAKRCMYSCDALLCILSVSCRGGRRVSKWREVARIAA